MLLYNKEKHASQKDFQEYPQLNSFEKDEWKPIFHRKFTRDAHSWNNQLHIQCIFCSVMSRQMLLYFLSHAIFHPWWFFYFSYGTYWLEKKKKTHIICQYYNKFQQNGQF
jgi:hypothetical protein